MESESNLPVDVDSAISKAKTPKKLGLMPLIGLVVGSAIGGGIFTATNSLASGTSVGVALIAWLIVGVGLMLLVMCVGNIVKRHPELNGVTDYADAGFGKIWGFISGWGYWLSAWLGNIAYTALLLEALSKIPGLSSLELIPYGPGILGFNSANIFPFLLVTAIVWGMFFLVSRGMQSAAVINVIVLIGKLVPILVALIDFFIVFKAGVFTSNFWTNMVANTDTGIIDNSFLSQLKSSFMVMIWCFVGIEAAAMFTDKANKKSDARKASIIGFIFLLTLYVLISIVPYGVFSQQELAGMDSNISMGEILAKILGNGGLVFVSIGLVISIIGALLSWTMLPAEALTIMEKQKVLPPIFGRQNKNGVPIYSLLITTLSVQVMMLTLLFPKLTIGGMAAYEFAFTLCSSTILITWLIVGLYQIKMTISERNGVKKVLKQDELGEPSSNNVNVTDSNNSTKQFSSNAVSAQFVGVKKQKNQNFIFNITIGILASAFQLLMIVLAGWVYVLLSFVTYIPGLALYYRARKKAGEEKPFKKLSVLIPSILVVVGGILAVVLLAVGVIVP